MRWKELMVLMKLMWMQWNALNNKMWENLVPSSKILQRKLKDNKGKKRKNSRTWTKQTITLFWPLLQEILMIIKMLCNFYLKTQPHFQHLFMWWTLTRKRKRRNYILLELRLILKKKRETFSSTLTLTCMKESQVI